MGKYTFGAKKNTLNTIRKDIQKSQLILIVTFSLFLAVGTSTINVIFTDRALNQNLHNTAELISRLYVASRQKSWVEILQTFDDVKQNLSEVDVISIVDENNIRLYHSNHELIATHYDGTIPDFERHKNGFYTENDVGPSGPQRRAYCVLYDKDGQYCGFTMTIILRRSMHSITLRTVLLCLIVTIFAVFVELIISKTLSANIKHKLLGYEPDIFSSMFKIRDNTLNAISDGIVAVNAKLEVEFENKAARKFLQYDDSDPKLTGIRHTVFIQKFLAKTISDGEIRSNIQERTEAGAELLIDCIPIKEDQDIIGGVAILHDRTEYTKLMEDLSGTKYLVDSMRANNHDFTNKLHVILGLIQIGQYQAAMEYIEHISIIQRETISTVVKSIDNPALAALLIGKIARSSECNVKFVFREGSSFTASHISIPSEALITIAGNLIDNALDAMNQRIISTDMEMEVKELVFGVFTKPGSLLLTVDDTGCGIADDIKARVFDQGFSTKGSGRGVGLYHTKQLVESLGGTISFESQVDQGTSFMVSFNRT
ncbi:MAG: Spo0B domain-containing protein [Treponema sp.]|nr:Spo0B domain-containing protein [Treponema sp.]